MQPDTILQAKRVDPNGDVLEFIKTSEEEDIYLLLVNKLPQITVTGSQLRVYMTDGGWETLTLADLTILKMAITD